MREVTQKYKLHPLTKKIRYMERIENGEKSYGYCDWTGSYTPIPVGGLQGTDKETGLSFNISKDDAIEAFKE